MAFRRSMFAGVPVKGIQPPPVLHPGERPLLQFAWLRDRENQPVAFAGDRHGVCLGDTGAQRPCRPSHRRGAAHAASRRAIPPAAPADLARRLAYSQVPADVQPAMAVSRPRNRLSDLRDLSGSCAAVRAGVARQRRSRSQHPSRGLRPGNRRRATPHVRCTVALLCDWSRIPAELAEDRAAAAKRSKPWRGGQPLLCPTSKRLLVTPHSFALEIEMLYEQRLAVIFRSSVASIKLRFSSRE